VNYVLKQFNQTKTQSKKKQNVIQKSMEVGIIKLDQQSAKT